ncbi:hypothetical protein TWF718_002383 [Orbilia javanica]|uniref:Peptidase S8/S53 domain-containing protein n=1 Tax=Orbilia javanica TaxID=47235 RepID=A0AAN8NM55_9PEZI
MMRDRQYSIDLLLSISLIICLTRSVKAAPKLPKIGTWEKNYKSYWVGLKPDHASTATKEDERLFLKTFKLSIKDIFLPPAQFAVYEMKSEFLGLMGLVIDTPASLETEDEIWNAVKIFNWRWTTFYMPCLFMREEGDSKLRGSLRPLGTTGPTLKRDFRSKFRRGTDSKDGQDKYIERRDNAPPDLVSLSKPPGISTEATKGIFWQWKNAGNGVTVYVMDSGCDARHPEFKNTRITDWIFPGPQTLTEPRDDSALPEVQEFHGTPVTAKIVGEKTGVARDATVVVVNMIAGNTRQGFGHDLFKAHDCLLRVHDHVKKNNPNGRAKCVINISYTWVLLDALRKVDYQWATTIRLYSRYIFAQLVDLGCYFTIASGNSGMLVEDELLLSHAADPRLRDNMVVVGGHDSKLRNVYDYGDIVKISVEAVDLILARGYPMSVTPRYDEGLEASTWEIGRGTSFASPVVAGLLATFISLGLGDPVRLLYSFAKNSPYPDQAKIAFNGIYADQWPKSLRPEGYTRSTKQP